MFPRNNGGDGADDRKVGAAGATAAQSIKAAKAVLACAPKGEQRTRAQADAAAILSSLGT